jgi:hypothetical protein
MKRIKAILIIATGVIGFIIMPTDNLLQAVIGLSMVIFSVRLSRRNWRAIYRELLTLDSKISISKKNINNGEI